VDSKIPSSNHLIDLIELGRIVKPHGYKGELIIRALAEEQSALSFIPEIYVGTSRTDLTFLKVSNAQWTAKGWKVKLETVDSEEAVEKVRGHSIFAVRNLLPQPEEGEYYIEDLVGSEAKEAETEKLIGKITGVEATGVGQDCWWIQCGERHIPVPATQHFIEKVDTPNRTVYIKNFSEVL